MAGECCIFQPFDDGGPFDKRFDEILNPAITAAGLVAYRVDRDPNATIPVETLHDEIRGSSACLADISVDNPNVWYELGFAIGIGRPVVIISSKGRQKLPFDIQHRTVILYAADSKSDFEKLGESVTERLKAELRKQQTVAHLASASPLRDTQGLMEHEIATLALVMANASVNNWISKLERDMEGAGFTRLAAALALKSLAQKGHLKTGLSGDEETGQDGLAAFLTEKGEKWLLDNQDKLQLKIL